MAEEEPLPWISNIRTDPSIVNTNGLSNAITTTKYSIISWLPKSLWEQFRRIANIYFLVVSVLMLIGTYAPSLYQTPLDAWSTVSTLVVVLMITSIKEGLEDIQRYKSDTTDNIAQVTIVTFDENGKLVEKRIEKQYIQSGDIVKLSGKCDVPVDMILLMTSNYADGNQCYIETSNIDGETNLKLREAPSQLMGLVASGHPPQKELFGGYLEFEPPNKNIHNFVGALHIDALPSESIPLSADNLLLRSSLFSNTEWAYGVALYCGQETKIQMNNRHAASKTGRIEDYLNVAVKLIFAAQVTLVTVSVISLYALGYENKSNLPYVYPAGQGDTSILPLWLEQWFVFLLLFNNFIPISLYVTIELVNVGQSSLIMSDKEIYQPELDCPCVVRSSNLCQELGMVSNIFSDKTGTLTRNEMKFVQFVVDGKFYEVGEMPASGDNSSPVLQAILGVKGDVTKKAHADKLLNFLRTLAVCHTVVREKNGTYRAESPDELALVEGVAKFNCNLIERGTANLIVSIIGERKEFSVLAVNAFNSDRKRMSILVKETSPGSSEPDYYLMCKGADNIIMALCAMTPAESSKADKDLLEFAMLGLRTLCISMKKLSEKDALDWLAKYRAAASAVNDRANRLADVAAEIEVDMDLVGITAIEDRLQDEVPEVIAELARAGIVVWMLTGDKEETAVSIGRSCNLIQSDTKTHFISRLETKEAYNARLQFVYEDMLKHVDPATGHYMENGKRVEVTMVMDGPSFKFFDDENIDHRKWLLYVGKACRSVVACRLTPIQKQMVVRLVKVDSVPQATCLAIGDGANDVSMIREGNVGVGIFGKEGRQAANNADFAIGEFKFLRRLILVHGRWNYIRQSRVFLYSMHKNMVLTLTLFWYSYYAAMSGTSLYESWVYTGYNFILGLPIISYGILDRDLSQFFMMAHPQTYATGRDNAFLNVSSIGYWILNAIVFAVILCLLDFVVLGSTFSSWSLYSFGTAVYTALCMSLQAKVSFLYHQWSYPAVLTMAISVGGMVLFFYILNELPIDYIDDYGDEANYAYGQLVYWVMCFITIPIMTVMLDFTVHAYALFFAPTAEMLFREAELVHDFKQFTFLEFLQAIVSLNWNHPSRKDDMISPSKQTVSQIKVKSKDERASGQFHEEL